MCSDECFLKHAVLMSAHSSAKIRFFWIDKNVKNNFLCHFLNNRIRHKKWKISVFRFLPLKSKFRFCEKNICCAGVWRAPIPHLFFFGGICSPFLLIGLLPFSFGFNYDCGPLYVIVNSRFLQRPQKRNRGNQPIHRRLFQNKWRWNCV